MADEENADDHILTWSPSAKENIRSHSQSLGSGLQHHFGGTRLGTKKHTSNFRAVPSAKAGIHREAGRFQKKALSTAPEPMDVGRRKPQNGTRPGSADGTSSLRLRPPPPHSPPRPQPQAPQRQSWAQGCCPGRTVGVRVECRAEAAAEISRLVSRTCLVCTSHPGGREAGPSPFSLRGRGSSEKQVLLLRAAEPARPIQLHSLPPTQTTQPGKTQPVGAGLGGGPGTDGGGAGVFLRRAQERLRTEHAHGPVPALPALPSSAADRLRGLCLGFRTGKTGTKEHQPVRGLAIRQSGKCRLAAPQRWARLSPRCSPQIYVSDQPRPRLHSRPPPSVDARQLTPRPVRATAEVINLPPAPAARCTPHTETELLEMCPAHET